MRDLFSHIMAVLYGEQNQKMLPGRLGHVAVAVYRGMCYALNILPFKKGAPK